MIYLAEKKERLKLTVDFTSYLALFGGGDQKQSKWEQWESRGKPWILTKKKTLDSIDDLIFTVRFILNKRGRKLISPDQNIMSQSFRIAITAEQTSHGSQQNIHYDKGALQPK